MSEERDTTHKDEETYYVPAVFEPEYMPAGMGHMLQCHVCGRKILVSMGLIGTVHHMGTSATCGECLVIAEEFRKQYPAIATKIENWLAKEKKDV